MTDREKLIELLDAAHDEYYKRFDMSRGYMATLADHLLANGVRLETKRATSEWISVEDRLPTENRKCLVYQVYNFTGGGGYVSIATFTPYYEGLPGDPMNGKQIWYEYDSEYGDYDIRNITHWMPLPEAPKEDKG